MKNIHDRKSPEHSFTDKTHGRARQTITMHPDDFKAHLAWVLAKRMLNQ